MAVISGRSVVLVLGLDTTNVDSVMLRLMPAIALPERAIAEGAVDVVNVERVMVTEAVVRDGELNKMYSMVDADTSSLKLVAVNPVNSR